MRIQPAVWISTLEISNTDLVDSQQFCARHLRPPLPTEVGIALAHKSVYETIISADHEWSVVLEDDALVVDPSTFANRLGFLTTKLPTDRPCIVNLNFRAATPLLPSSSRRRFGLWKPCVPTYTTTAYLLNRRAAEELRDNQTPIRAQADWPIYGGGFLFLQETERLVQPRPDISSLADPTGERAQVPRFVHFQTWSWLWYAKHRKLFSGPKEYGSGVLLPRLMRHIYNRKQLH